jgi:hypothetical protein
MLQHVHFDMKGGNQPFAAIAVLSFLSREAVIQTCGTGAYKISE